MVNLKGYENVFIVLKQRWEIIVFLLCFVSSCFARTYEDSPEDEPLPKHGTNRSYQLRISCFMLTYVQSKGCDYVMAFVKGHYSSKHDDVEQHHWDTPPRTCDWKPWVERKCMEYHVYPELCCALIDCGATRSITALGGSMTMFEKCNTSHAVTVGKRMSRMCDPMSVNHICQSVSVFGKRSKMIQQPNSVNVFSNGLNQNISTNRINVSNSTPRPVSSLNVSQTRFSVERVELQSWCKIFSRKLNKKYHLNEVKFVRRSVYWLVDIYRVAHRHRVPKSYTHGLVGCGMEYAMVAFNVAKWQSVLYSLAL